MRKTLRRILLPIMMVLAVVFGGLGTADAAQLYGGNTCWATGHIIRTDGGNGVMYDRGCGWYGYASAITSPYPFRVREANGSEVCYRANYVYAYPRSTWRAWTVGAC